MHPLRPDSLTLADARALMRGLAERLNCPAFVVWDGGYQIATADDLATYYPRATVIARTNCDGCGDELPADRPTTCANCDSWDAASGMPRRLEGKVAA